MSRIQEFSEAYRAMPEEQLMHLTTQMEDLVPEARTALLAVLESHGRTKADIEQFALQKKNEMEGDAMPNQIHLELDPAEEQNRSCLSIEPFPADWSMIPGFYLKDASLVAECLKQTDIPFHIKLIEGCRFGECMIAVAPDRLTESLEALKIFFGFSGDAGELFSGDCPACGTKLENAKSCPDCGLELFLDPWKDPTWTTFVKFLKEKNK